MQFIVILAVLVSAVSAGNFMMHDRVCANPLSMNNIVVVCNDINFSNANDDYAVYLYELDRALQTRSTIKLNIDHAFVEKAIAIDATHMFLIAETRSKCVEVLALDIPTKKLHTILTFCDTSALSLEDEYYPHTLLFSDGSLLFSMERAGDQDATVELLYLKDIEQKRYDIVRFPNYKDYVVFKMMPYKEGAIVLLRSQKRATDAVLITLQKNAQGRFDTSILYETHTQMLASFDIDNEKIFLYGNEMSKKRMSLFFYEIDATGVLHRHLDAYPMAFQPIGLKISNRLFLTGVLSNSRKKPVDLGLVSIGWHQGKAMVSYDDLEQNITHNCSTPLLVEDEQYMSLFFKDARQVVRIDPVTATIKEKITLPVSHVLLIPNSPRFLKYSQKIFLTYMAIEGHTIKNIIQEVGRE